MAEISISRIKRVAKASAATVLEQTASLGITTTTLPSDPARDKSIDRLFELRDVKSLRAAVKKIIAQDTAKLNVLATKVQVKAAKQAVKRKRPLAAMVARRLRSYSAATQLVGTAKTELYLIDTPFSIEGAGLTLDESALIAGGSYAKFKRDVGSGNDSTGLVTFKFNWVNTRDQYAVINVHGYVVLNGDCTVQAVGGFYIFDTDRRAQVTISPHIEIFDYTNEPFPLLTSTSPFTAYDTSISANDRLDIGVGFINGGPVFRGYDIDKPLIIVEPRQSIGLNMIVSVRTQTGSDSGQATADFISADNKVMSPAFLVSVVS
jgi:hypothetical protein